MASFTGTQAARKASGGLNPSADLATATLTVSGGSVTGVQSSTPGANMQPGIWQTITSTGGFRGQAQVKTDGTLDWTTLGWTGTGHDGVALSAGTGMAGTTATAIITRKATSFIIACRIRQTTGFVNGETLLGGSSSLLTQTLLTGVKLRSDLSNGTLQLRTTGTANLSSVSLQDHILCAELQRSAWNSSPPGQQLYLNNADIGTTPTNYGPVVDGTSAGLIDTSNIVIPSLTLGANNAGTASFAHVDLEWFYLAFGLNALDAATGQVPDFSQQTVRDRFLAANVGATGSGVTGRQPQVFMIGSEIPAGTNRGTAGNLSTIVGTF
jgi:hypothetical protein